MPPEQARFVEVTDAMVDTAATHLMVPRRLIAQLGLRPFQHTAGEDRRRANHAARLRGGAPDRPGQGIHL